jgi:hypothetical protein
VQLSAAGGVGIFGLNAFSVAGLRGWVAADRRDLRERCAGATIGRRRRSRSAVSRSCVRSTVRDVGRRRVAGGNILANDGGRTPLLLVMSSDGRSWEPSVTVDPQNGFHDHGRAPACAGDTAWASATDITSGTGRATLPSPAYDGGSHLATGFGARRTRPDQRSRPQTACETDPAVRIATSRPSEDETFHA